MLTGYPGGRTVVQETRPRGAYEWHQDPVPRFVITLSGTLEFETKSGATFTIRPSDVLLAQDNTGMGHAANCELNYTPQSADGMMSVASVKLSADMAKHRALAA